MRILSWNVNGLRAIANKGFGKWLRSSDASIVALQETRAHPDQLTPAVRQPRGWRSWYAAAERKGYSGVGLLVPKDRMPDEVSTALGDPRYDVEGRYLEARFGRLTVANGYFPNGNGTNRDNSRIPYKLGFYQAVFDHLRPRFEAGEPVLVMGDFNTAPEDVDLARPKSNHKTSGFTPEEREDFRRYLAMGWVDTFRHLHPDATGRYTWWSQRFGVREKNIGWRIDFVLASPGAMPFLKDALILSDATGSDHCPVGVEVSDDIVG
ncbi:MAG: exodeoxyribonuclease III [Deltaproteobacteria bacterium]|nr:MAG: exodeoxyribonuclease III [Deltaproteobacteria bacterium]